MSKTAADWLKEGASLQDKEPKKAIECFDQAIALDPNCGEAYFRKAFGMQPGTEETQVVLYAKALEVGYDKSWTNNNYGNALMGLGRLEEAIKVFQKLADTCEQKLYLLSLIGLLYEQMENKEKAREYYELCFQKNVAVALAGLYAGKLFSREGKYQEALEKLQISLDKRPDDIETIYQLGNVHKALGDNVKALECYNKAIVLTPENPNDWCNRGLTFIALGRKSEGIEDLKRTKSELETIKNMTYSPGYTKFMKATITSILEAEELAEKTKTIEEKLAKSSTDNVAADKFKSVLKKLKDDKEAIQTKLIGQLSGQQSSEGNKNIDEFNKLKTEFEMKLMEMQQEINQVKTQVNTIDNKVTAMQNDMEVMKEELNNKLDDFSKKLNNELDKLDLTPEDKEKLNGYFKAFVGTISSAYVTAQVVHSGQVSLDVGSNAATVLSTIASFAPFIGNTLSSGITKIGEFLKSKELKSKARIMKGLASDAVALSQLLGGTAFMIVLDKKKLQEIIKVTDQDMKDTAKNLYQQLVKFCKELDDKIDVFLYTQMYKTPAERMGHQDANLLIEKWIDASITPFDIQNQFVEEVMNQDKNKKAEADKTPKKIENGNRSACCSMF